MPGNLFVYFLAFFVLWMGAGLIVSSVDRFSKKLRVSSFAISFFILGLATSIPEFAVGMTAIAEKKPEVYVGNLIGGIPIIFLLIIPFLAIIGNGVTLKNQLSKSNLLISFVVMLTPAFLILDGHATRLEAIIMIGLYCLLFFIIQINHGLFDAKNAKILSIKSYSLWDFLKVVIGVALAFISSQTIVDYTLSYAQLLNVSPFYISLVFLSLGTNLPEFSLAIRSVLSGKKDVAFGDYVGSAAANTLLFGIFVLITVGEVVVVTNFFKIFLVMVAGLALFYYFTLSKNDISRKEGFILFAVYIAFFIFEQFSF